MSTDEQSNDLRYRDAVAEIEAILAKIECDETDVDALAEHVERAAQLIELCRAKIEATETRVRKVFDAMQSGEADAATESTRPEEP